MARRAFAVVLLVAAPALAASTATRPPSLPSDLGAAERTRINAVTETASIAIRWEADAFPARRDVFEYLLDHPDFATHITRALKVARYRVSRTKDGLHLDDGWGTRGHFEVVHAANGVRGMYARGDHEQRWLPSITGEAVVVFEYGFSAGSDGKPRVTPTIGSFVKIDSRLLAALTRLAGPYAKEKAEKEAQRLAKVFMRVSRAIEEEPARVYELLRQRPDVPARELDEFRRLLNLPRTATP